MKISEDLLRLFIEWTKLKVRIHVLERELYFYEGQIWWTSLGQNIGSETNGKNGNFERPVLVLKKFNERVAWILPISSKDKQGEYFYSFINPNGENNVVALSQLRLISSNRFIRKVGDMSAEDFMNVRQKIRDLV